MRVGKLFAICALGGAVAAPVALAAPGKLVDKGTDDGNPIAFAHGDAIKPKKLKVRVRATPRANLEVLSIVTCAKGKKKVKAPEQDFILLPTTTVRLNKGYKKPDECTVDVQAAYQDAGIAGQITIEIYSQSKKTKKKKKKR
jgi:hypothetical protein